MAQHTGKCDAIYLRLSDDKDGTKDAVKRQLTAALIYVEKHGLNVPPEMIFTDNDISASGRVVRPDFERLMTFIEDGKIGNVVAYKIDRISRNATDTARFQTAGLKRKVIFHETSGQSFDLAHGTGQFLSTIMAGQAALENLIKSERMRSKNEATRAAGMIGGGRRSFGYKFGKEDGRTMLIIVPDEAKHLRAAYEAILKGASVRSISRKWNDLGLTTVTGNAWNPSALSRLLKTKRNAGILTYGDDDLGRGSWEAIVDEITFQRVLVILSNPSRISRRGAKRLLTGVARCGYADCGAPMNGGGQQHGRGVYACTASRHLARLSDPVDDLVVDAVFRRLSLPDALESVVAGPEDTTAELLAEKRDLISTKDDFAALLRAKALTRAGVIKESAAIDARIEEIDAEIARQNVAASAPLLDLISAEDIEATWKAFDVDTQRTIIDGLFDVVIMPSGRGCARRFDPEKIKITFKS